MELIKDVLVVGDKQVIRNLFYPEVIGRSGLPILSELLGPGGGKSGITLGERLRAFEEFGIGADRFHGGIATSAGAYDMLAYCARQTHLIADVYKKISWLNPEVLWRAFRGDYLGLLYLEEMVRDLLDEATLRKCTMDLKIGVADLKGNPIIHRVKDSDDPCRIAAASSALFPVVPGKMLDGVYSVDGGFTIKSSVMTWLAQLRHEIPSHQEVDLLFIANRPHPRHEDLVEEFVYRLIARIALRNYPELMRGALSVASKLSALAESFERKQLRQGLANRHIRMCAIYPQQDENIYPNEWRRSIFDRRGALTRMRTEAFLKEMRPVVWA